MPSLPTIDRVAQLTATNSSFSQVLPGLQLAWDSTSLGNLKKCPRFYYYTNIAGYRTSEDNADLTFGIGIHRGLECYELAHAETGDHDHSVREALRGAMLAVGTYVWEEYPGDNGYMCGERKWQPWKSTHSNKTLVTLLRSIVWYLEQFGAERDLAKTVVLSNGKPAVELPFRFELDHQSPDGTPFLLCGHLDRVVDFGGKLMVMDRKSTKSTVNSDYFDHYTPDNQMSIYSLASKVIWGIDTAGPLIVDAIQVAVRWTRVQRGIVPRTPGQLEEVLHDTSFWVATAQSYAEAGYWPLNDKSCYRCAFRPVCSKDPGVRDLFLESNYVKRQWDPLSGR